MELQTAGTTASTQKKIYEKPRIEIVNLVPDEMVLVSRCQQADGSAATLSHCELIPLLCQNS